MLLTRSQLADRLEGLAVRLSRKRVHTVSAARGDLELLAQAATALRVPDRERLPETRQAVTRRFRLPWRDEAGAPSDLKVYASAGLYPDGRIGEVFLRADKTGSLTSGTLDAVAMAVSIGLQYGVPLAAYTSKMVGTRFEPAGLTGDKEYRSCTSVLDLVGRWLSDRFVKEEAA